MADRQLLTSLPPHEYHGMPRISSGGLKRILQSPAHFKYMRDNPQPATPAMEFGTLVHTCVLEPEKLEQQMVVIPEDAPSRQSKAGKEWWEVFNIEHEGKIRIDEEKYQQVRAVAAAILEHGIASGLLAEDGMVEASGIWRDDRFGVLCKMRPDFLFADFSAIIDVKTTGNASRDEFQRTAWRFRYDMQAAFYIEGVMRVCDVMPKSFVWIVAEVEPPHAVAVYRADPKLIQRGMIDCDRAMEIYARCLASNEWPGYRDSIQPLDLPRWAYRSDDSY